MTNPPTHVGRLFDLTGRVALISGAGGWLGGAMAEALAEAGATVAVTSRRQQTADAVAEALPRPAGVRHVGVVMDHMDAASIDGAIATVLERAARIDVLVNNGNEGGGGGWRDVTPEQFNRQLANCTGYFALARHVRDHAVSRRGTASVINIGSMYSLVGSFPEVYEGLGLASPVAYHALKGAIAQMTRHLAVYWAKDGVRVNCLSPGPFPSPKKGAELERRLAPKVPMGRVGRPHELKGAVVFLASDASSYMTGQNLVIDGGWTAW